ncbi:peptidoglycan-associated lipoprotein [Aerolutibacter ruishenii]|uniref:Peptidoglycan-associated lipoprotein n=1 Tax=Aerolutibacter ruishenii TaxID=686800 RepID=A0A562M2E4_9GAMM|nr:OmpA family protein [Lysobacter ruishenii]TWI14115.1 peptidoglycan-associated lipoprotein [Lysobacter ruishenii]
MNSTARIVLAAVLCTAAVACSKKVKEAPPADTTPVETAPVTQPATTPGLYGPADLDSDACLRQRVIYFDFDQDVLRPEFQAAVGCHAKYLRDRPSSRMTLQGHADERGSREYNLGLGERRGNAVSSALQANGGSASQQMVNSSGEEMPVCTESNEDCWAKNRRVEIIYTTK